VRRNSVFHIFSGDAEGAKAPFVIADVFKTNIFIDMEVKLNIPDYLSVKHWKEFNSLEHLTETEKMVYMISILSDKTKDEVREWTPAALTEVYSKVLEVFQDMQPQFYPVFELDDVLYGFTPISKLSLGEYMDLERLAVKSNDNLEEIMAILYRPITKHRFRGIKWAFKSQYKVALGEAENLFKYYEVEKYDSSKRLENADKLSVLPATMCLGALSFFLVLGSTRLLSSNLSSLTPKQQMETMKEMSTKITSMNIGDGLLQFITSLKHPSFQSQAINQYLN